MKKHESFQQSMQELVNDVKINKSNFIPKPTQIQASKQLSMHEIKDRQKKTWESITDTLQGIWECMDSIDKTNIKRIDKVFQKLQKLEELHVKNIQHSLHHIAMLRDEVSVVNNRINHVFQRLSDLEQISPSEWLEWTIPKYEIPFEDGIYLRSPGYEVGSMIWCIELRWELDETLDNNQFDDIEHEADIQEFGDGSNPIIDMRETEEDEQDGEEEEKEQDGHSGEYERINKGYNRLGIYVSPRSVANWERLSSLKATCEVRINENDYSDAISVVRDNNDDDNDITPPDKVNKKQQHFSVSGEFLRGKKLTSWGRTINDGDQFFDKTKIDDEICVKLRIVNQTLTYQQYADDIKDGEVSATISDQEMDIETSVKPRFESFDFKDKESGLLKDIKQNDIDTQIQEKVQQLMTISIMEFWEIFSKEIESGKSKQGYSFSQIAKSCKLDLNLVSMFRKGPMTIQDEEQQNQDKDQDDDQEFANLNSKQRERRRKSVLKRKLGQAKKWEMIVEYDLKNPDFRRKLATFLVKHQYKKQRNLQSKAGF